MARPKKLWKEKAGRHGFTVWAEERTPGGNLYLRWWDGVEKRLRWECLGHTDKEAAAIAAKDLAHSFDTNREAAAKQVKTLAYLFGLYEREESVDKEGKGPQEDRRRMDLWQAYLGDACDPMELAPSRLKGFIRDRRAGRIKVPGRKRPLEDSPSDTTVGNDIRFLQCVLTWAAREGHIAANPIRDFQAPRNVNVKRPVATYDRFLKLRPHCHGLFGPFMDLVESLGWRVSALRQLRGSDIDLKARPGSPRGRILKRQETDKVGVEAWVPLSVDARAAIEAALELNPVIGDAYLFPAPRAAGKPWGERYTYELLVKAEKAADIEHLERGAFHPYRRKWRRERKHLPRADVAAAGGWLDPRTLDIYDGADEETILAVVEEPRKLREAR